MKAFIIYLPEREHSVRHSQMMLDQLKEYNIDAELFEGTPGDKAVAMATKSKKTLYPYSIKNRRLNDQDVKELIRPELYENFKRDFPDWEVDLSFETPNYKVQVGRFKDYYFGLNKLKEIKKVYPAAFLLEIKD